MKTRQSKTAKQTNKPVEQEKEVVKSTQLLVANHFPTMIYLIERPDFLDVVSEVSEERLEIYRGKDGQVNEIYPMVMTDNFFNDIRLKEFSEFVGGTAWNILNEQGYAMQDKSVTFTEMWTQEHHKHSLMEQHVHGYGSQIVGFYFLEAPENCSRAIFHDPRAGKMQIDLPEQNVNLATPASRMVNFEPKPGLFIFANSWLPHSFGRHAADKPIKFVHFNLAIAIDHPQQILQQPQDTGTVEVV
jgi:uncharacterized protein (TIGR02466 family)